MNTKLFQITGVLIVFFAFSVKNSFGQFQWVKVGVDGVTCSQCSRSVELSIRKLDFVLDVRMNFEHPEGKITFKSGETVDVEKIAKAVVNAGFSVRYLSAGFIFKNTNVSNGSCYLFKDRQYQFVKTDTKILNGEAIIIFIGKSFMQSKEYRKWKPDLIPICDKPKGPSFYITL